MMEILKSAAKLGFLMVTLSTCVGLFTGHVSENNFMFLASSAFGFYFANKGSEKNNYLNK